MRKRHIFVANKSKKNRNLVTEEEWNVSYLLKMCFIRKFRKRQIAITNKQIYDKR